MVKKVKKVSKKNSQNSILDFFKKLNNLYFHPNKFLKSVEGEKEYFPLLRTAVLFYFSYFVVLFVIGILTGVGFDLGNTLNGVINAILIPLMVIFIFSGAIHLGVLIFKGKQGFFNTLKPITYAYILGVIYLFIMLIVGLVFQVDDSAIQMIANAPEGTISQEMAMQAYKDYLSQPGAFINSVISLIFMVHAFVFSIKGIAKFQKLKKAKAFGAVVLPWVILFVILFVKGLLSGVG